MMIETFLFYNGDMYILILYFHNQNVYNIKTTDRRFNIYIYSIYNEKKLPVFFFSI